MLRKPHAAARAQFLVALGFTDGALDALLAAGRPRRALDGDDEVLLRVRAHGLEAFPGLGLLTERVSKVDRKVDAFRGPHDGPILLVGEEPFAFLPPQRARSSREDAAGRHGVPGNTGQRWRRLDVNVRLDGGWMPRTQLTCKGRDRECGARLQIETAAGDGPIEVACPNCGDTFA